MMQVVTFWRVRDTHFVEFSKVHCFWLHRVKQHTFQMYRSWIRIAKPFIVSLQMFLQLNVNLSWVHFAIKAERK